MARSCRNVNFNCHAWLCVASVKSVLSPSFFLFFFYCWPTCKIDDLYQKCHRFISTVDSTGTQNPSFYIPWTIINCIDTLQGFLEIYKHWLRLQWEANLCTALEWVSHLKRKKSCGHQRLGTNNNGCNSSRGAAVCTATVYLDFRIGKKSYCMLPLTWFVLFLHRYPSFSPSLLPHSWQVVEWSSHEAEAVGAHSAHVTRTARMWQQRWYAVEGSKFQPSLPAGSLSISSAVCMWVLLHLGYQTGNPSTSDCIFPAATQCTFCIWQ